MATSISFHEIVDLRPMTKYSMRVYSHNMMGSSETYAEVTFTTDKLYIPVATLTYDDNEKSLQAVINSTDYCTKIQVCYYTL